MEWEKVGACGVRSISCLSDLDHFNVSFFFLKRSDPGGITTFEVDGGWFRFLLFSEVLVAFNVGIGVIEVCTGMT